jgi:DNA-directed RNA polymerase specialized sigma24 family protein
VSVIDEPTRRLDEGALRGVGRDLIPRVLAGLVRRGEDFDAAEDALQEALLEALRVWPEHPPRDPRAWLATVATRRLVDARRSERLIGPAYGRPPTPARRRATLDQYLASLRQRHQHCRFRHGGATLGRLATADADLPSLS